jgi:hypothetical protein
VEAIPPEKRTVRQIMEADDAQRLRLGFDHQVRQHARALGAKREAVEALVRHSRVTFRVVEGRAGAGGQPLPLDLPPDTR